MTKLNKDANYDMTYNPIEKSIIPIKDDLTTNHSFINYYNEGEKKIDSFVMLAGPVRDDYAIDYSKFTKNAKIVNVYDTSDLVQRLGGIDFLLFDWSKKYTLINIKSGKIGIADQKIKNYNVQNIKVEIPSKNFYDKFFGNHSKMDSKDVWEQVNGK